MKRFLVLLSICLSFIACQKNIEIDVDPAEVRLESITGKFTGYSGLSTIHFKYDDAGRPISLTGDSIDGILQVSYPGNQVEAKLTSLDGTYEYTSRFVVNSAGKPTRRVIRTITKSLINPDYFASMTDTTVNFYDADGLLIRSEEIEHDSTRYSPDPNATDVYHVSTESTYVNSNKNLVSLKTVINFMDVYKTVIQTYEDSYVYEYDKKYSNKLDFSSELLINELQIVEEFAFTINKNYSNLPNRVTYTTASKSLSDGVFTINEQHTYNIQSSYDSKGWLTTLEHDGVGSKPFTFQYK